MVVLAVVTAVDQVLKLLITWQIPPGVSIPLVPGILALTHVRNPGIAFGLFSEIPLLVPAVIAISVLFLLVYGRPRPSRRTSVQVGLALIGAGALGNLLDRLRVGAVIDYIDLHIWPVFNLADVAVTVGACLLILTLAVQRRSDGWSSGSGRGGGGR